MTESRDPSGAEHSGWLLSEASFVEAQFKAQEGLMTQGNGAMHLRASLEEGLSGANPALDFVRMPANVTGEKFIDMPSKVGFYIPGIYAKHYLLGEELVNLPFFIGIGLNINGERMDMKQSRISGYERTLDMRNGLLTRSLTWTSREGAVIRVVFERFLSVFDRHLCLQRVTLQSDRPVRLIVEAGIDADVRTNGFDHFRSVKVDRDGQNGIKCQVHSDEDSVDIVSRLKASVPAETSYRAASMRRAALSLVLALEPGQPAVVEKTSAVASSRETRPVDLAACAEKALSEGWGLHLEKHTSIWEGWWNGCDVVVDSSDPEEQIALRASLYHLLRCKVVDRVSIDAKGYAGDAYFGRFFWDTEIQMLPFYLYTSPDTARNLVGFRIASLPGALENGKNYGYKGAKYPWESSLKGTEQCACWQYADHEIHIGADIVYAFDHFARAVDPSFTGGEAARAIIEIARFYASRIDIRQDGAAANILGVMGPNEYTPISNNNAYINTMARFTLRLAARVGAQAGLGSDEAKHMSALADKLVIVRKGDLILQCEGFDELADPQFERFWTNRNDVFSRHVSQERLYRSKVLKQADVLMLPMLFPESLTDREVRAAWDYYLPYTTHDSSLSPAVHALIALRLGLMDQAVEFWQHSLTIDTDVAGGGAKEGIHIAAAGMNWQVAVMGFGGLSQAGTDGVLRLQPQLPPHWRSLSFPLTWQGQPVKVNIEGGTTVVRNCGHAGFKASVGGESRTIAAGQQQSFAHAVGARS